VCNESICSFPKKFLPRCSSRAFDLVSEVMIQGQKCELRVFNKFLEFVGHPGFITDFVSSAFGVWSHKRAI